MTPDSQTPRTASTRALLLWLPCVLLAAAIFALSSIPGSFLPHVNLFESADKVVHAAIYCAFGVLVARALSRARPHLRPSAVILLATAVAAAYGATDELHQTLTPLRTSDVLDVVADSIGGLAGSLAYVGLAFLRGSSKRERPAREAPGAGDDRPRASRVLP